MIRLFVPGAQEGVVTLEGPRFHYVARVLRLEVDDALEVFDGHGLRFLAKVTGRETDRVTLALAAGEAVAASRPVAVVQGLPKGDKLELVLQKGTELGASAFVPAPSARSVVKLEGKEESRVARWQRIVEEAARQCGRADVPVVHPPTPLTRLTTRLPPDAAVLVLDEEERALPLSTAVRALGTRPLALVIGPEGGLTREEVQHLVEAGATSVTLGPRVLRTETAALAALSVIRHLDGELG